MKESKQSIPHEGRARWYQDYQASRPVLAPLPGTVQRQRVRCGKANCKCARGELHAAHYRFWREGGRLRKAYVRRAEVERTRAACAAWKRADAEVSAVVKGAAGDEQRSYIRAMLRDALGGNLGADKIVSRYR